MKKLIKYLGILALTAILVLGSTQPVDARKFWGREYSFRDNGWELCTITYYYVFWIKVSTKNSCD